jgi:hypothetical protein
MRIASESVADNELCRFNALVSALTAGRRMTSHMDMLRRSNIQVESPMNMSLQCRMSADRDSFCSVLVPECRRQLLKSGQTAVYNSIHGDGTKYFFMSPS